MNLGNQNKIIFFIYLTIIFSIFISFNSFSKNLYGYAVTIGALDKITAKFSEFDIEVNGNIKFGTLLIEIFECQKRPPEEIPENFVLLKIEDHVNSDGPIIFFSGWMLSSSPSISSLEHPTYDIWIKDCKVRMDSE